ncbi:isoprenoid synthase domain-containing protein [Phellopilus nigrolimitatus]|nr:isoprenoid synthase domain-containing protein [Phellopilus nigrolimitatus]
MTSTLARSRLAQFFLTNKCRATKTERLVSKAFRRAYATGPSSSPSGGNQDPIAYCRDFVRQHDRDSYLISQFFPRNLQPACFAVKAFYVELAMIQDSVSNPLIGQMRMQFWKDAVQQGRPPGHPIATALHDASRIAHIAPYHLKRIIEARDVELNSPAHLNMDTLLAHAESTSSTLNYILLSILGLSSSETFSHAASHLGASQMLITLLRALPYHASKGVMVIPASITAKHHVNQEEVFRRGPQASVVANDHLITAREMFKENGRYQVPRETMPVFLNAVPVQNYLKRLEAADFDVFDPKLQLRDSIRLPWQIWRNHLNNTF